MMEFNKLVRDRIPEIIEKEGGKPVTRTLELEEYSRYLEKKLDEEVAEYHESKELEELADVLEVVYALAKLRGYSVKELEAAYQKKHEARGGFEDRVFLIRRD